VRVGVALTGDVACGMVRAMPWLTRNIGQSGICACRGYKGKKTHVAASTRKFGRTGGCAACRGPASKGEWGLLIIDGETGETLYE